MIYNFCWLKSEFFPFDLSPPSSRKIGICSHYNFLILIKCFSRLVFVQWTSYNARELFPAVRLTCSFLLLYNLSTDLPLFESPIKSNSCHIYLRIPTSTRISDTVSSVICNRGFRNEVMRYVNSSLPAYPFILYAFLIYYFQQLCEMAKDIRTMFVLPIHAMLKDHATTNGHHDGRPPIEEGTRST